MYFFLFMISDECPNMISANAVSKIGPYSFDFSSIWPFDTFTSSSGQLYQQRLKYIQSAKRNLTPPSEKVRFQLLKENFAFLISSQRRLWIAQLFIRVTNGFLRRPGLKHLNIECRDVCDSIWKWKKKTKLCWWWQTLHIGEYVSSDIAEKI